jgi:isopentenyl-diphosphate delta-isomerase
VLTLNGSKDVEKIIARRKSQHVEIALREDVEYRFPGSGFDDFQLEHCALPEIALSEIDTSGVFLNKTISMPLLISPITGGTEDTFPIVKALAEIAQEKKLALSVGSQRIALEHASCENYFGIRKSAPDVPLLANLGAVQLNYGLNAGHCQKAVDMLEADALVLHLNPLHECLQQDGNTDFGNLLPKIEEVVKSLSVPVIVKEVGFGISAEVARKLAGIGVYAVDIAGSGGTCWPLIEARRAQSEEGKQLAAAFVSWGLPTAHLLQEYRKNRHLVQVPVIASGGIRSGIDIAKSIAMGASLAGIGLPFLRAAAAGVEELAALVERLRRELVVAMFCAGARNIRELSRTRVIPVNRGLREDPATGGNPGGGGLKGDGEL